ncbi:MAG TPA: chromate efflux transporter [Actinomycetota bacterium]|nr:chromate efflux transporter [Actinomycetota bacterium]
MRETSLRELAQLFLKLGSVAFGGPAAHVAMMQDEVVDRRRWFSRQRFLDLVGATNLIPGPNSTELAIHIGYERAGWAGLLVAGSSFIVPAMLIVMAFAWAYVEYGSTPAGEALLYGVQPVVIAIVVHALAKLAPTAAKDWLLRGIVVVSIGLFLAGMNELLILFGLGLLVMLVRNAARLGSGAAQMLLPVPLILWAQDAGVPVTLERLFLTFLKIGAVLYGGGYVILAFLQNDFVDRLGWLTQQQLIDAVSVGQVTPGPVFTTATFIGYVLKGVPGALLATLAIFLPSFFFVAISHRYIERMRSSKWFSGLLDGVNAAAVGLMAGVTIALAREAIVDVTTVVVAVVALGLLAVARVNSAWLILAGGAIGLLVDML